MIPLRGLTTVGVVDNSTIVGRIDDLGKLRAIYNSNNNVIIIRLLGYHRIELSYRESLRYGFGAIFRPTMLVNFVEQPNARN